MAFWRALIGFFSLDPRKPFLTTGTNCYFLNILLGQKGVPVTPTLPGGAIQAQHPITLNSYPTHDQGH
jgi:hypothetical protein